MSGTIILIIVLIIAVLLVFVQAIALVAINREPQQTSRCTGNCNQGRNCTCENAAQRLPQSSQREQQ